MGRFIEEFYYGNIDPQARSTKQNKTVQKQMEVLMKTEELLTSALKDEQKKWFLDLQMLGVSSMANLILIVSLWDSALAQTLLMMRSSQVKRRLKIYLGNN